MQESVQLTRQVRCCNAKVRWSCHKSNTKHYHLQNISCIQTTTNHEGFITHHMAPNDDASSVSSGSNLGVASTSGHQDDTSEVQTSSGATLSTPSHSHTPKTGPRACAKSDILQIVRDMNEQQSKEFHINAKNPRHAVRMLRKPGKWMPESLKLWSTKHTCSRKVSQLGRKWLVSLNNFLPKEN